MNPLPPFADNALKYLALGDSYTIGEAVVADHSFPYLLTAALSAKGYQVNPPDVIAVTGWTTDELIEAICKSDFLNNKYDLVTLLIGVNDQYRHYSLENYRVKFEHVLNTAIDFAAGDENRIVVLSIPDWGVTPFADGKPHISEEIDQLNHINKQISIGKGVNYIDITEISRQAAIYPELIASDGLHPSAKMYNEWLKVLLPVVFSIITKGDADFTGSKKFH